MDLVKFIFCADILQDFPDIGYLAIPCLQIGLVLCPAKENEVFLMFDKFLDR